ncbi:hypothetical protein ACJQWK_05737 [Exserohilum turcicum]
MEPPAKRMRIWQSVEVDEENSDYVKAKQKQQQKFKGRLESIFEKYGNMHESMSDEIDMKTNRVVVDRGHLRRLKRQVGRKEALLLDTLGLAVEKGPKRGIDEEEEEIVEDSEDELAPSQPVKSKDGQPESDGQQTKTSDDDAQPNTLATSIPQFGGLQTPNTPVPTTNILPAVQFPQTPAGQQAQATFYMTLTQGIGELVQRAMIQSGLLPYSPIPPVTAAPPVTSITTNDKVVPATDPKWFFPPLSAAAREHPAAQSSPLPIHAAAVATGQAHQVVGATLPHEQEQITESTPLANEMSSMAPPTRLGESSPSRPRRASPRVEVQRRRIRSARKYHFTKEDDEYISEKKKIDQLSWAAIKESQEKWKDWPLSALTRRWAVIKDQNLHLQTPLVAGTSDEMPDTEIELDEQAEASPIQSHHLPTPSSSEHGDGHREGVESPQYANGYPSSAHFDDDELELLSLTGREAEDEEPFPENPDEEISDPLPEDVIIPSIEANDVIDEDDLQRDLLENLPLRDATLTPPRLASIRVKTEPIPSSPIAAQVEDSPMRYDTVPDSDTPEEDTSSSQQNTKIPALALTCPICNRSFKTPQTLARHKANPRNTHTHPALPRKKATTTTTTATSLDRVAETSVPEEEEEEEEEDEDDDPLILLAPSPPPVTAPTTPAIKREPSTPSTSFFLSTLYTPNTSLSSQPRQRHSIRDANTKHPQPVPGAVNRKQREQEDAKAHMKRVKQCWKGKAAGTTATTATTMMGMPRLQHVDKATKKATKKRRLSLGLGVLGGSSSGSGSGSGSNSRNKKRRRSSNSSSGSRSHDTYDDDDYDVDVDDDDEDDDVRDELCI